MKLSPFSKGLLLIVAATTLVGSLIFFNYIIRGEIFSTEEAQHGLYSAWLCKDIQTLNWGGFWYDTGRQMAWPFLHSWIQAVFFLFFGISYISARSLSFVIYLATIVLTYTFSNQVCGRHGRKIGILASLLALSSPMMIQYATTNALEGLGALLFLAAANAYTICEERKITLEYIILALLICLSVYTNYLYAYLILPAFIVGTVVKLWPMTFEALELRKRGEKHAMHFVWWAYRKLIVLGILLTLLIFWFSYSYSRKIILLFSSIFRYLGGVETTGFWDSLAYYPGVIVENLTFSPWLGLFVLISLLMPFTAARYRWINKLYIYVWTVILLLAFTIPAKAPQLLYIVIPFIFIIFSSVIFYFVDYFKKVDKKHLKQKQLAMALIVPLVFSLPQLFSLYFPGRPAENLISVFDFYKSRLPAAARVAAPILSSDVVRFHFHDWPGEVITELQSADEAEYFLALDLDYNSPYNDNAEIRSLFSWSRVLEEKVMNSEIVQHSSRAFDSLGLTARIFQKIAK